jgi:hypothetical protein
LKVTPGNFFQEGVLFCVKPAYARRAYHDSAEISGKTDALRTPPFLEATRKIP